MSLTADDERIPRLSDQVCLTGADYIVVANLRDDTVISAVIGRILGLHARAVPWRAVSMNNNSSVTPTVFLSEPNLGHEQRSSWACTHITSVFGEGTWTVSWL